MRALLPALLLAVTSGPTPAPMPDYSPTLRGVTTTGPQQDKGRKVHSDLLTVAADAGAAYASTCVPNTAALHACPSSGNAIQCVTGLGWYGCQADGGWVVLGAGSGSGISGLIASSPLASSGGGTPTLSCNVANGSQSGCLSAADWTTFNGKGSIAAVTASGALASSGGTSPNITCAAASGSISGCLAASDWTIFNAKESALTFTAPLSRSTNAISLSAADAVTAGYITTAAQSFGGAKAFASVDAGVMVAASAYVTGALATPEIDAPVFNAPIEVVGNCNPSTTGCAAFNVNNTIPTTSNKHQTWGNPASPVATIYNTGTFDNYPATVSTFTLFASIVQDPTGSSGVTVLTDRSAASPNSDFIVDSNNVRTAGSLQSWENGHAPKAQVDPYGMFVGGVGGVGSFAAFQDGSGVSGHPSLTAASGFYPVVQGRLGEDHNAVKPDAGRPVFDGGQEVCLGDGVLDDGGSYYCYAGLHGDTTADDSVGIAAGWLFEWHNAANAQNSVAYVDYAGGFGQHGGYTLAKLGRYGYLVDTSLGQFYYGQLESTLNYAFGSSGAEHHWFYTGPPNPDGGSTYDFYGADGTKRQIPAADETLTWSASPSGTPNNLTLKEGDAVFVAGAKSITLSASLQYANTPTACHCEDTSAATPGAPVGCQWDKANSGPTALAFVGIGTDTFHYWCEGK